MLSILVLVVRNQKVTSLSPCCNPLSSSSRRQFLNYVIGTSPLFLPGAQSEAASLANANAASFDTYQVIPDSSSKLDPGLKALSSNSFLKTVTSQQGALWLGEHHNSQKDHDLQATIIEHAYITRARQNKPLAIGLEQVQVKFQNVLDNFVEGNIDKQELLAQVEWEKRWMWPFSVYERIFDIAQHYKIPIIALNVNSEDLALVERGGFPGTPREILGKYIKDPQGFASFAQPREFSAYVDYVIKPSYDMHEAMGILKYTISGEQLEENMPFRNFFSGRILWDEAMAARAYRWSSENPDGLMIGLVGADHVKFGKGIPGRYARMVRSDQQLKSKAVMLNPTLIDTRPSGSVGMEGADSTRPDTITLQLRFLKDGVSSDSSERALPRSTGGVLALADYILVG